MFSYSSLIVYRPSLVLLLAMMLASCDDETPPIVIEPDLRIVAAPEFLACNLDSMYLYKIRVQDFEPDSVTCTVTRPDNSEESFALYDDANTEELGGPEWASSTSLDQVGNNGVYTRGVQSNLLCGGSPGDYQFWFRAFEQGELRLARNVDVSLAEVEPCVIMDATTVLNFTECFENITAGAQIDFDSQDNVDSVWLCLLEGQTILWQENLTENGSQWDMSVAPTLFRCVPTGTNYSLLYSAFTRYGFVCERRIDNVSFTNSAPVLSNVQMPDTIYRPIEFNDCDSTTTIISVDFTDCEHLGYHFVNDGVQFDVSRDDTMHWGSAPDFFLRDDGIQPDNIAGDGLSHSFLKVCFSDSNLVNNLYYFRFFAIDCATDEATNFLLDSVRVIWPGQSVSGTPRKLSQPATAGGVFQ